MAIGFDMSELEQFDKDLLEIANIKMPKESKKFLKKEGTKLKNRTTTQAKRVKPSKKDHGEDNDKLKYHESIKRGKPYKYKENGALSIRVYSSAPHAHLIEYGHRQVTHTDQGSREVGFVKGKHIFESAKDGFEDAHCENVQKFIDDVLDEGLC